MYSNLEYTDIHFYYGLSGGNAAEASRLYAAAFPERRHPDRRVFSRVHQVLRERGSFSHLSERDVFPDDRTENILQHFDENPRTSLRRSSLELNVPRETIRSTLTFNGRKPYHVTPVQELVDGDSVRRVEFCEWFFNSTRNNRDFAKSILWTDEATFTKAGIFNLHNTHVWAEENPYEMQENSFQHNFKVNIWVGMLHNRIIGPHVLPDFVNSQNFRNFLEDDLPNLIEDIPIGIRQHCWFQLDGCPAHYGRPVRQWLDEHFLGRWVGRGGPVAWPPRSPDLTPLDFFLWGTLKELVYQNQPRTRDQLIESIHESCLMITNAQVAAATASVRQRCLQCMNVNGNRFEALPRLRRI